MEKNKIKAEENRFEKLKIKFTSGKGGRTVKWVETTENPTTGEQKRLTEEWKMT